MGPSQDEPLTSPGPRAARALGLDVLFVGVFTLIGRRTHEEPLDLPGWWWTAWPFLAGLAIGWLVVVLAARTWPTRPWHGLPVWLSTVFAGMAFRGVSGQGTALPFVLVSVLFLGATLLGWRLVQWALERRRPTAPPPPGAGRGRVHPGVGHTPVTDPLGLPDLHGPREEPPGRGVVPPPRDPEG